MVRTRKTATPPKSVDAGDEEHQSITVEMRLAPWVGERAQARLLIERDEWLEDHGLRWEGAHLVGHILTASSVMTATDIAAAVLWLASQPGLKVLRVEPAGEKVPCWPLQLSLSDEGVQVACQLYRLGWISAGGFLEALTRQGWTYEP